jgi:hypothetical protein
MKRCVVLAAGMEVDIENRRTRRRRSRYSVCRPARYSRSPGDAGLATWPSRRASTGRRNDSGCKSSADPHPGATRSGETTTRLCCRYVPGHGAPRSDRGRPSRLGKGNCNSAGGPNGEPRQPYRPSTGSSRSLPHSRCVPRDRRIPCRRNDSISRHSPATHRGGGACTRSRFSFPGSRLSCGFSARYGSMVTAPLCLHYSDCWSAL